MRQEVEVLIHTKFCSRKIMYVYTSELLQTRHGSKLEYVNLSPVHYLKWLNSFNKTDGRGIKTERRIVWSGLYFTNIKRPHLELVIRLKIKDEIGSDKDLHKQFLLGITQPCIPTLRVSSEAALQFRYSAIQGDTTVQTTVSWHARYLCLVDRWHRYHLAWRYIAVDIMGTLRHLSVSFIFMIRLLLNIVFMKKLCSVVRNATVTNRCNSQKLKSQRYFIQR